MVLVCQSADTRLAGEDGDHVGTMKLSEKDLHRILEHGRHFPFLTTKERGEGDNGHWRTRTWETRRVEKAKKGPHLSVRPVYNQKSDYIGEIPHLPVSTVSPPGSSSLKLSQNSSRIMSFDMS